MTDAAFDAFCRHLCETLGATPPQVSHAPDTPAALSLQYRDVALVLAQAATAHTPRLCLLVDFGEVPAHEEAQVYPALLQANFMMLEGGAPSFSLHPATGRVTYQIHFDLAQADPQALAGALEGIADAVLQWRQNRLFMPAGGLGETPAAADVLRA